MECERSAEVSASLKQSLTSTSNFSTRAAEVGWHQRALRPADLDDSKGFFAFDTKLAPLFLTIPVAVRVISAMRDSP